MALARDSFQALQTLSVDDTEYHYYSLPALRQQFPDVDKLPYSLRVLLENLLRFEDGKRVEKGDIEALIKSVGQPQNHEIAYCPARVLMQDFTGVPAVVDLAAMRDAVAKKDKDPALINPQVPVDLVIDHSVMVDAFASDQAFRDNVELEMERNLERYQFLRWGQQAFNNFSVVPPGTGICHQVNLEYLGKVVWQQEIEGKRFAYPDTLVGTDSHTTMINGLGVLGWGVGGIEAEAAMLGQPVSMLIPDVVGFEFSGKLKEGITATDLVLTVVQMLRELGVVGKFVEFYGQGMDQLPLADRATIANMAPEYGATCGFFPVDQETLNYLALSGRDKHTIALVEQYSKAQGLWRDSSHNLQYRTSLHLDLSTVVPSLAGPKRPQDRVPLDQLKSTINDIVALTGRSDENFSVPVIDGDEDASEVDMVNEGEMIAEEPTPKGVTNFSLSDGDVVIAAITSCTNTSNPAVMLGAGLLAKKAVELGLERQPWVKSSLAPGSKVVTDYLAQAGLQSYLDQLGFNLVGYGCTTCIGNSGPLPPSIENAIDEGNLTVCSVLSGNRNFEGRIHGKVRANWLASPPLVVAYALAGSTRLDLTEQPLGTSKDGNPVFLKDIWPSNQEISDAMATVSADLFRQQYADVFTGDEDWRQIEVSDSKTYPWSDKSTYIQNPPFFTAANQVSQTDDIKDARILALLGDSITTDHISPAGSIGEDSPAGQYLIEHGVAKKDFNSYGSRRGNHDVMMRGTFANVRIKNEMCPGVEGGYTKVVGGSDEVVSIYDAAMNYQETQTPLVVFAGKEYGTGSSRDWAAKGTRLLGVRAVIAESFERIHRSNLVGMGVLPLQFVDGENRKSLALTGLEKIQIIGLDKLTMGAKLQLLIERENGDTTKTELLCRIDTDDELSYYLSGGILQFVIGELTA